MEQDSLEVVETAVEGDVLVTLEGPLGELEVLAVLWKEFAATPLVLHVVWQTKEAPTNEMLAKLPGKKVKQYWDAGRKTASTGGKVRVKGQLVAIDWLPLRVALARAAVGAVQ
jgi:hypothetical protein